MGSQSDWPTMKHASKILNTFKIKHEVKIISAHRTPKRLFTYAEEADKRGIKVIIAGAGVAAHIKGKVSSINPLNVIVYTDKSTNSNDGLNSV